MKPTLYDLYGGQGGAARGYQRANFRVVSVDLLPQPRCCADEFIQMDAFEFIGKVVEGKYPMPDAWHASPVCKGYSVMNNLPWLKGREYPLHILPIREAFEAIGKPYVIENVMGARYGAKGLVKRGLESHGMQAGWLCGTMFGLPLYRHRLFETNFLWLAPEHPKHRNRIRAGASLAGRARDIVFDNEDGRGLEPPQWSQPWRLGDPPLDSNAPRSHGSWEAKYAETHPGQSAQAVKAANKRGGTLPHDRDNRTLATWQDANGVGVGHAKGWRLAAAAWGVEWMDREGTSQAIPPCYTEYVGAALMQAVLARRIVAAGEGA